MYVESTQTSTVKVKLDKDTIALIVRTQLLKLIGFESYAKEEPHRRGVHIEDGDVVRWWEEGGGSHSWFEYEKLRKATELDIRVFDILKDLKKSS